jgi:hypothetical protein
MSKGRPTDYNEEILNKTEEYLNICQDEERQLLKMQNEDRGYETYENKLVVKLPTVGGLARYLGVSRDTIYEWKKLHQEFSDIIEQIMAEQEDRLINKGMSGDYNPTIAKVLLSKHGYREGQDLDHTTKGEKITDINYIVPNGNPDIKANL